MPFRLLSKLAYTPPLVLTLVLCLTGATSAHRPLFPGPRAADPDSAVRIADPAVSYVIYSELTEETPYTWFVFENDAPREVAVQLGLPEEPRRHVARPVVVLFGPGLPDPPDRLPVAPPQGDDAGATAVTPTDTPEPFSEPVMGTKSRIVADTHLRLPSAGTYYGVLYDAEGEEGKVWVSIGQREGFGWRDITRLPGWIRDVRRFHEVSGWPSWAWMSVAGLLVLASLVGGWIIRRRRAEGSG